MIVKGTRPSALDRAARRVVVGARGQAHRPFAPQRHDRFAPTLYQKAFFVPHHNRASWVLQAPATDLGGGTRAALISHDNRLPSARSTRRVALVRVAIAANQTRPTCADISPSSRKASDRAIAWFSNPPALLRRSDHKGR